MDFSQPFSFGNLSPIQRTGLNQDQTGMNAAWQQLMDFYTGGQSSSLYAQWLKSVMAPEQNRYAAYALANPTNAMDWTSYISQRSPTYHAQYMALAPQMRGSNPYGMAHPRILW